MRDIQQPPSPEALTKITHKREIFEALDNPEIMSVTAKHRGKLLYQGPVDQEKLRKAIATAMVDNGRKFVLKIKLSDGTSQRYRGNGVRVS